MSDLTDGLAALTQQRAKATAKRKPRDGGARELLPPRHPAKAVTTMDEPVGESVVEQMGQREPEIEGSIPDTTAAVSGASPAGVGDPAGVASSPEAVPLRRLTFYVDEAAHEWLEDIAFAGRRAKPRVDASRSAVVRLALERLMGEVGVDAVVGELQGRAQRAPDSPGRKRI